jgi:glyoxylase-like metal-dependent hydrolase (beta-lactamase superfamily II)
VLVAGPGRLQGFAPHGARLDIEGCDVVKVRDGRIVTNEAHLDSGGAVRQLGLVPASKSRVEGSLTALANLRTRVRRGFRGGPPEPVAAGVWVLRGGFPSRTMNVYLLADDGAVTVFDAGIEAMVPAIAAAAARLGGVRRVVLGHADADHRGAAPGLHAPVYCHAADREAAQSHSAVRPYWDLHRLDVPARSLYPRLLRSWDGGAVPVAGTVAEGDEVAGFSVIELPGHAPGLIGLWRESDRLALVSDCLYTLDPQSGRKRPPGVPHVAFNQDTAQARASIRKLAALEPAAVWPGHAEAVTGDVAGALARAAAEA